MREHRRREDTQERLDPPQTLHRALQRLPVLAHLLPEVADLRDPSGHRPQRERPRADVAAFNLVPPAGGRHRRARPRAYGVGGGERRAVAVASGVDKDAAPAIGLAELLRQVFRIALDEGAPDGVCERRDLAETRSGTAGDG